MACSCDSCSAPRIIKTRTALFWRWLAETRGETADRVIPAPVRAVVSISDGLAEHGAPIETAAASSDVSADDVDGNDVDGHDVDGHEVDQRRADFLKIIGRGGRI